jgi:hypothetical protein
MYRRDDPFPSAADQDANDPQKVGMLTVGD